MRLNLGVHNLTRHKRPCGLLLSLTLLSHTGTHVCAQVPPPPRMEPPPPPLSARPPGIPAPPPMEPPPPRIGATVPTAQPAAKVALAPIVKSPCPNGSVRLGTLCFSPASQKRLTFSQIDDHCASLGMKVPGLAEYRHASPYMPEGVFPKAEAMWMADAWQNNRNTEEKGGFVMYYGPGNLNFGPYPASVPLPVACVDRLLKSDRVHSTYVGLSKERVLPFLQSTKQQDPMWCWAAVAQMILALRGRSVSQEDIVRTALGDVMGKGVSSTELAQRLSRVGVEAVEEKYLKKMGVEFTHHSKEHGAQKEVGFDPLADSGGSDIVDSRQLVLDLFENRVFIFAYGTGASRAHAVLLIGADITVEPFDFVGGLDRAQIQRPHHKFTIKKYHLLNPWPNKGYQVVSPDELEELVKWRVSLSR